MTSRHLSLMLLVALAACGSSDDPNQGGLIGGLIGLGSGSYERRVAERQEAWSKEEAAYQDEITTKSTLDQSLAERRDTAIALDQEIASLEQEVIGLNDEIASLRSDQDLTEEQIALAEADAAAIMQQIEQVRQQTELLGDQTDADRAAELQAEIGRLQDMVDVFDLPRPTPNSAR